MTAPERADRIQGGLNDINQGFEAGLFHPDFGNEVVRGRLFLDRWKLHFRSEPVTEEIGMEVLQVEFEEGGERIYFSDPNRPELKIFTSDHAILKHPAIRVVGHVREQVSSVVGRRETRRALRLTAYFVVGCVVATWLVSASLSFMVRTVADRVPMSWEDSFGKNAIAELRSDGKLLDDTNEVAQLAAVAAPLISALPENRRNLKFYILDDSEPNAFALPGGYVVVHSGLLAMVDTPEQLLGVLAHEIAHETQRHMIRHEISAAGPLVIFGVFLHSRSGVGNLLALGSGLMVFEGFSQEYEQEADDVGWKYLVAANIDPHGMIETFKKLQASEDPLGLDRHMSHAFDSHPALTKRIKRLEGKWDRLDRKSGFLELPPVTWPKLKDSGEQLFPLAIPKADTNE